MIRNITKFISCIGCEDPGCNLFEGQYPVNGMTYNSYILIDNEHTCLFDTADKAVKDEFLENLDEALGNKTLEYIVVNHMEPDHSSCLGTVLEKYPDARVVGSLKTSTMIENFTGKSVKNRFIAVKDGDTLTVGRHTLRFLTCPMVHWPEVIMTYDERDKVLFSADAFGTFGTRNGALFDYDVQPNDEEENAILDEDEFRRYYTNIVGKYGINVMTALKKAEALDIEMICPLHGFVGTRTIPEMLDKYKMWATYTAEQKGVLIAVSSVYGNTLEAAKLLAKEFERSGIPFEIVDLTRQDSSYAISLSFKYTNLCLAATTYNGVIFPKMDEFLTELLNHNVQNKSVSIIENGSWAATSGKLMKAKIETAKNITFVGDTVSIKSAVNDENREQITGLAKAIAESVK